MPDIVIPSGSSVADSSFDHYFNFSDGSPYSKCNNNLCVNESGNYGGYTELSPYIINYFSSNLNRRDYGENNMVSNSDSRIRVVSGFDLSSDYTLAVHAFTSGDDSIVFDNNNGTFRLTNKRFFSKSGISNLSVLLPETSGEVDVLIRRLNDSYRIYSLNNGIDNYVDWTPPSIAVPTDNNTYILPNISGHLCELFYSASGWSDSDINTYLNARYSLESHLVQPSGYIQGYVPLSSGYNEIPLNLIPRNSIKESNQFFDSLSLPIRIDYNSIEDNPNYFLNVETSSDFNITYSGEFLYRGGNINFLSVIPSGLNVQTSIPVYKANNEPIESYDSDFTFNSKVILGEDNLPYSGFIRFHSLDLDLDSFETTLFKEKIIDLFLQSTKISEKTFDLYTEGHTGLNSGLDLITDGVYGQSSSIDLFLKSNLKEESSLDMYLMNTFGSVENINFIIPGTDKNLQDTFDLFTYGTYLQSSGVDLSTKGTGGKNESLNLFVGGVTDPNDPFASGSENFSGSISNNLRMFIGGYSPSDSVNMFIKAEGSINDSLNMYIGTGSASEVSNSIEFLLANNNSGIQNSVDFTTIGTATIKDENLNLYIGRDYEAVDNNIPMFIKTNQGSSSGLDFSVKGSYFEYNTIDMFISGSDRPNKDISLYIHGF